MRVDAVPAIPLKNRVRALGTHVRQGFGDPVEGLIEAPFRLVCNRRPDGVAELLNLGLSSRAE
jgi:hypothetical protein